MKTVMVHRVRKILQRRQQGSAALITTIAVSAILVVLFVGITTIATREIRQSINSDNANRALYAAEAGVEDAVRRLGDDPKFRESTCNASNSGTEVRVSDPSTGPDVAWTCRTVTVVQDELTGQLDVDESLSLNLGRGRSGPDETAPYLQARYMSIEWNDPRDAADAPASQVLINRLSSWLPTYNPDSPVWQGAAALEVTSTWFGSNNAGQVNKATINQGGLAGVFPVRTVIASPACPTAGCNYSDFSPWNTATYPNSTYVDTAKDGGGQIDPGALQSFVRTDCTNSATVEYSCTMKNSDGSLYDLANLARTEINNGTTNVYYDSSSTANFENSTMFLRVRPRYNSASYRIRFYAADRVTPVYMPDGNATIDVTARSGDYFRRVLAKKQLVPTVYDGVFDNAIFSGADICKNMRIYRDYRGAPDYLWASDPATGVGSKQPNADAGKNDCGTTDQDV